MRFALLLGVLAHKADPEPADVHATNAELSAHAAQKAANVANQVTQHAQEMHENARVALHHARGALQDAKAESSGMTAQQHEALSKADAALEAATKKVEQEQLEEAKWVSQTLDAAEADKAQAKATASLESQIAEMEAKIAAAKANGNSEQGAQLDSDLAELRKKLADAASSKNSKESLGKMQDELAQLEHQVETMEDIHDLQAKLDAAAGTGASPGQADAEAETAALRKELKELQDLVGKMSAEEGPSTDGPSDLEAELANLKKSIAAKIAQEEQRRKELEAARAAAAEAEAKAEAKAASHAHSGGSGGSGGSGSGKGLEVDSEMPFGELEPFGREDTATELTEASIDESDKMVDQIERAEVAEEKRSVFRAITRLRGAAITSFDGIARSQTGNIDEYNHNHQWRQAHPLHHLADEESDVAKWAFPDNAD